MPGLESSFRSAIPLNRRRSGGDGRRAVDGRRAHVDDAVGEHEQSGAGVHPCESAGDSEPSQLPRTELGDRGVDESPEPDLVESGRPCAVYLVGLSHWNCHQAGLIVPPVSAEFG